MYQDADVHSCDWVVHTLSDSAAHSTKYKPKIILKNTGTQKMEVVEMEYLSEVTFLFINKRCVPV